MDLVMWGALFDEKSGLYFSVLPLRVVWSLHNSEADQIENIASFMLLVYACSYPSNGHCTIKCLVFSI
jgi:hypothetical protein